MESDSSRQDPSPAEVALPTPASVLSSRNLGSRDRPHAARSARCARHRLRSPLPATSRLIVDTARPSRLAMVRSESPAATPREISSRSVNDKSRSERRRRAGRTPPTSSNNRRIDDPPFPTDEQSTGVSSPASRRSCTSAISASVNLLDAAHLPTRNHNSRRRCCIHALRRQAICATWYHVARPHQLLYKYR